MQNKLGRHILIINKYDLGINFNQLIETIFNSSIKTPFRYIEVAVKRPLKRNALALGQCPAKSGLPLNYIIMIMEEDCRTKLKIIAYSFVLLIGKWILFCSTMFGILCETFRGQNKIFVVGWRLLQEDRTNTLRRGMINRDYISKRVGIKKVDKWVPFCCIAVDHCEDVFEFRDRTNLFNLSENLSHHRKQNKFYVGPIPNKTKFPTKDLISEAQKRILKTWQNYWDSIPNNKLRSSENRPLQYHPILFNHTKKLRPAYDTCKSPLTIEHITINCPKFLASRHLLNNPASLEEALNQDSQSIFLSFSKDFTNFVKNK
ncbi:hypothetical protein AGLY_015479 [Aphis glycines]|uniref:Uncharacterized protein n=1 Tax=Aphis glycines TaxID=307491 RepID=A0A6G0T1N7_APHGL|nr:hypothetical protein AGLY_015479 [Aphis glycines]